MQLVKPVGEKSRCSLPVTNDKLMTVNPDPFVFAELVIGLYSQPYLASVRELICNAMDSTRKAGTKTPIDLHLPTKTEPYFSIRDYGTGLSDYDLENHFCIMGNSSKLNDDTQTGCFGIGRLAILSTTKIVELENYFNGKKTSYHWFLNTDSRIVIRKLNTVDTDKPNGLYIKAIYDKLTNSHIDECEEGALACRFSDIPIKGREQCKFTDCLYYGSNWGFNNAKSYYSRLYIIICDLAYVVPDSQWNAKLKGDYYIRMEPGTVDFVPSRDSLKFTEKTRESIRQSITEIEKELKQKVEQELIEFKDDFFLLYKNTRDGIAFKLNCYDIPSNINIKDLGVNYAIIKQALYNNSDFTLSRAKNATYIQYGELLSCIFIILDVKTNLTKKVRSIKDISSIRRVFYFPDEATLNEVCTLLKTKKENFQVYKLSEIKLPKTGSTVNGTYTPCKLRSKKYFSLPVDYLTTSQVKLQVKSKLTEVQCIPADAWVTTIQSYRLDSYIKAYRPYLKYLQYTGIKEIYVCRPKDMPTSSIKQIKYIKSILKDELQKLYDDRMYNLYLQKNDVFRVLSKDGYYPPMLAKYKADYEASLKFKDAPLNGMYGFEDKKSGKKIQEIEDAISSFAPKLSKIYGDKSIVIDLYLQLYKAQNNVK